MQAEQGAAALNRLLALVAAYQNGHLSAEALRTSLTTEVALQELVRRKAGQALTREGTVIDFGAGSQLGEVQIRDVAGRDIINLTINLPPTATSAAQNGPSSLSDEERAHKQNLLTQHRKMLHALELQAAQFGLYTPPHITIQIDDLKGTVATLQRELDGFL
ncbi:MAG: hypothetical protein AB4911_01855 [Oscillochloridaceae bacterium umkhey_bin13]